jgi:hypothetical protein
MAHDDSSPRNPSLRYLESVKRTATDFWNDQFTNWNRVWGRVQDDVYTFGKLVRDAFQTWDGWMYGASRVASLPDRQFEKVLPVLTLLTDEAAGIGPKGQIPAPDDFQFKKARAINSTEFSNPEFEKRFDIQVEDDSDRRTIYVEVVAKGLKRAMAEYEDHDEKGRGKEREKEKDKKKDRKQEEETKAKLFRQASAGCAGKSGFATIYQGDKALATIELAFKR